MAVVRDVAVRGRSARVGVAADREDGVVVPEGVPRGVPQRGQPKLEHLLVRHKARRRGLHVRRSWGRCVCKSARSAAACFGSNASVVSSRPGSAAPGTLKDLQSLVSDQFFSL